MTKLLEEEYFDWLVSKIAVEQNENIPKTYDGVFKRLYRKEFVWLVPNDDNRIGDALDLRSEFLGESNPPFQFGVSVLEVVVALSRRLEFNAGGNASVWAWQLLRNLRLHKLYDPLSYRKDAQIDQILDALIFRTYKPNGMGGFFPLTDPPSDQTKVEIWYQMSSYIQEHSDTLFTNLT